jgi:hypothetical protein
MSRRDIYRQRAEDCLVTATLCKSPERKAFLTAMAHAWHRLSQPKEPVGQGGVWCEQETAPTGRNR